MAGISIAAALAATFDLICSGTTTSNYVATKGETTPYSYHVRIDLNKGLWCHSGCTDLIPLVEVQPGSLTLWKTDRTMSPGSSDKRVVIDRQTGELTSSEFGQVAGVPYEIETKARCEAAPFSGFPVIPTKF